MRASSSSGHPGRRFGALAATLFALLPAQAQVQVYGTIDVAAGEIATQPPGAPNAAIVKVRGVHSGALQTSFWGLRGTEDLGGGLRARFLLESFIRVDTGATGRFDASPAAGADYFWSREAYVALGHELGEVRLGTNGHPTWIAMIQSSAMGANSVFSPGFRQLFNGGTRGRSEVDTAMVNSIKVQSSVVGGVSGSLAVQAGEGSGSGHNSSANIGWRSGPMFVTAAFSTIRHAALPNLPGVRHQDITLVGGAYDFGAAKVYAQYVSIDNSRLAAKDKVPQVGVTVPVGPGLIQLAWGEDKTTSAVGTNSSTVKRTTTSAGCVYALSKGTELYTFVTRDDLPVGNADSYVVGIRQQF